MNNEVLPNLIAFVLAVIGGFGGLAAFLKVTSDNAKSVGDGAKSVSDGAKTVVELMSEQVASNSRRIDDLEVYVSHFDAWADRLLDILDRAVTMLPEALRVQFESEAHTLKSTRPRRSREERKEADG